MTNTIDYLTKMNICISQFMCSKKQLLLFLFLASCFVSYSNLSLTGYYQGKNLQIQNPEDTDGFGFCITKVNINGNPIATGIQSNIFEIDFTSLGLKIGDPIVVVIEHGSNCSPLILNPEDIAAFIGFEK